MAKSIFKCFILPGIIVAVCFGLAVLYSLFFNEGRLIYSMDFSTYTFQTSDLPMLIAMGLVLLYIVYLLFSFIAFTIASKHGSKSVIKMKKRHPKLGYLGCVGFVGFFGIATYIYMDMVAPFIFFAFFGFFGYFLEGKMTNIMSDERYMKNRSEAKIKSMNLGYRLIFILLIVTGFIGGRVSADVIAILLTAGISLIYALVMFMGEYLLYRYDHMDAEDFKDEQ